MGTPIAHPVPFLGRGVEDVGATVVGVVDALHPGVGDEDARHLVVGDVSEQVVDAATAPGPAGDEEVDARASARLGRAQLFESSHQTPRYWVILPEALLWMPILPPQHMAEQLHAAAWVPFTESVKAS
ncbi:Scr1 family TA system antitoxin-like transcriptional regulator [Streptomyces sp. NPDC094144]|uniref:Scr1 family TA system antitoxin-like transcriptional regulator n=1 Tax=Streptomyces sp. NPDC094144 TaxID=3366056 RepID=UPI003806C843